jgi:hypothetical protein
VDSTAVAVGTAVVVATAAGTGRETRAPAHMAGAQVDTPAPTIVTLAVPT